MTFSVSDKFDQIEEDVTAYEHMSTSMTSPR